MADQRRRIRMSDEEVWRFIEASSKLQLATLNRDGSPHLVTMHFAIAGGAIILDTYAKAQKALNMMRDARVALLMEAGEEYRDLRGVVVSGRATRVEDFDESCELKARIQGRYSPASARDELLANARKSRAKRVVFRITPAKITSWDHRKVR